MVAIFVCQMYLKFPMLRDKNNSVLHLGFNLAVDCVIVSNSVSFPELACMLRERDCTQLGNDKHKYLSLSLVYFNSYSYAKCI